MNQETTNSHHNERHKHHQKYLTKESKDERTKEGTT